MCVCVIFHNKNATKIEMHRKPLAQCKFSLKKVVVGSFHEFWKCLIGAAKLDEAFQTDNYF